MKQKTDMAKLRKQMAEEIDRIQKERQEYGKAIVVDRGKNPGSFGAVGKRRVND